MSADLNISRNADGCTENFQFVHKYGEEPEFCRPALYRDGKWYADYVRLRMKAIKN